MLNSGEIQVFTLRSGAKANNVLSHYVFSTSIWKYKHALRQEGNKKVYNLSRKK